MHCPDDISSVADGVTRTLEEIGSNYVEDVYYGRTPCIPDIGLHLNNVWARVDPKAFAEFHGAVKCCASKARSALDDPDLEASTEKWREIFGNVFPTAVSSGTESSGARSFVSPNRPARPRNSTFA